MTVDKIINDSSFYFMLLHCRNISAAMAEIQQLLSSEQEAEYEYTEQDLYEQIRKIIQRYE